MKLAPLPLLSGGCALPARSLSPEPSPCVRVPVPSLAGAYDYGATNPNATARQVQRYETVFKSTIYETEHPVVQVHPLTGERAIILGYFVRRLLGVSSADSAHLFTMVQDHVTRLENTVRWHWAAGDVVIWDNRAAAQRQSMITATSRASCAA